MIGHCTSSQLVYKFWLPVIGLYTGMRVGEICQLNPYCDILKDKETGIWYFFISSDTEGASDIVKSVKSGESRVVPIHSRLIELGLLDYTDALKESGYKRMFPLDKPREKKAGGNTSRTFRRFIENIGLRDNTTDKRISGMHAFRKTIITKSNKEGYINNMLSMIGHETEVRDGSGNLIPTVTLRYIDKDSLELPLSVKKETIEKVKFDIEFYKPVKPVFTPES